MIKQENPNFVASFYAPNPMEVTYWIDLSTDVCEVCTDNNTGWFCCS